MVQWYERLKEMSKNARKRGRSARNGNRPSPYTKYNKMPYVYSSAYHEWRRNRLLGKTKVENKYVWKEAAE